MDPILLRLRGSEITPTCQKLFTSFFLLSLLGNTALTAVSLFAGGSMSVYHCCASITGNPLGFKVSRDLHEPDVETGLGNFQIDVKVQRSVYVSALYFALDGVSQ